MPIYAYRCDACDFRKDVLQKMSDPVLTICPSCGAESFAKQLSAPAFQLKGTGWYVTDFRDNGKKADGAEAGKTIPATAGKDAAASNGASEKPADKSSGKADGSSTSGASASPAGSPAPAPAPAAKPAAASTSSTGGGSGAS